VVANVPIEGNISLQTNSNRNNHFIVKCKSHLYFIHLLFYS
jgi:hypothetical protein